MATTENQKKAVRKYDKENTVQVLLKLNKNTDIDIINYLEKQDSKMGYIKQLIADDMERTERDRERFLTGQELREWNEEHDREDTLYYVDRREYNKRALKNGIMQEINGDPVRCASNLYKEVLEAFQDAQAMADIFNEKVCINLMRAKQVYNNDLEYESVLEWSNIE